MFKKGSLLREVPVVVISALVVSVLVKTFLVHFFFIPSGSMENTLKVGDRIAVNKFATFFSDIKRGEVVVFKDPNNWLGEAQVTKDGSPLGKIKSGLEWVGVLPDPAKQYLIKRVIGVGGDHVICCNADGKLEVNGSAINEPYIFPGDVPSDMKFDVKVPKEFIWVMGDHRGASADSRFHTDDPNKGMVPIDRVTGRAVIVIWPLSNIGLIKRATDLASLPVLK